jgi:hypothetical protein
MRSPESAAFTASHHLGLGVSFAPVQTTAGAHYGAQGGDEVDGRDPSPSHWAAAEAQGMAACAASVRHLLGVQSSKPQQTSQVDHLLLIHLQRCDSGATSRCQADKQGKVVAPHKMFGPVLLPRVE